MPSPERIAASLLLLAGLAGCGSLPRPFQDNPGRLASRLSQPPPARLAVPVPATALLADAPAAGLSNDVTAALVDREIAAVAGPARRDDWRLILSAELRDDRVVPSFTVQDPTGKLRGSVEGASVPAPDWSAGTEVTLRQIAVAAAPRISDLLTSIEATRQMSDPNSLLNRPARIGFRGVSGAPGDGNRSLARYMREQLLAHGEVIQDGAEGADYTLAGVVSVTPTTGGKGLVEIDWTVTDARGQEAGAAKQGQELDLALVGGYWGDLALAICAEAAGGVHDIIDRQRIVQPKAAPPA